MRCSEGFIIKNVNLFKLLFASLSDFLTLRSHYDCGEFDGGTAVCRSEGGVKIRNRFVVVACFAKR